MPNWPKKSRRALPRLAKRTEYDPPHIGHCEKNLNCTSKVEYNTFWSAVQNFKYDTMSLFIVGLNPDVIRSCSFHKQLTELAHGIGKSGGILAAGLSEERLAAAAALDGLGGFPYGL